MRTKIIIEHDSKEALKDSMLWTEIMLKFMVDGPVSVVEISADDEDEDE